MQRPRYPPNPAAIGGLPSGPRARSAAAAAPRRAESNATAPSAYAPRPSYDASSDAPTRSLRQQRSFASLSAQSDRGRSTESARPPLPSASASLRSRSVARPSRADVDEYPQSRISSSSSSSSSSTGSSLMDRMRVRSKDTTPRTSFDEDGGPKGDWTRRPGDRKEDTYNDDAQQEEASAGPAPGASLWDRLASAAGSLTVSVGQAWATNVSLQSGEETPPGGESRLTRAMKAYHLQQARSPADLPDWLFEPHERGIRRAAAHPSNDEDDGPRGSPEASAHPPSNGFRDIYRTATLSATAPVSSRSRFADESGPAASSAATNRLKALRDAKRQANGGTVEREAVGGASRGRAQEEEYRQPVPPPPMKRMGLPTGPAARRVRPVAA